jgi:hypothetical protein
VDALEAAGGESRIQRERDIGRGHDLVDDLGKRVRQSLAAKVDGARQTDPATIRQHLVGVGEAVRHRYLAVIPAAALDIGGRAQRRDHLFPQLGGLVDQSIEQVRRRFREGGNFRGEPAGVHHVIEDELDFLGRCAVAGHVLSRRAESRAPRLP